MLNKIASVMIAVGLSLSIMSPAMADDGTIRFTGTIINSACTVSSVADTSGTTGSVTFGTQYTAQSFPSADTSNTSVSQNFSIKLSDCTVGTIPTITFNNGTTTSDSTDTDLFVTSVTGYGIKIVDGGETSTVYANGTATGNSALTSDIENGTSDSTTSATLPFTAYLVRYLDESGTGDFSNTVTFTLDYSGS